MEIVALDPQDDAALRAWHATYLAADTHGRAHAIPWALEEMQARFAAAPTAELSLPVSGLSAGEVVCCGLAQLPLKENLDLATTLVWTRPDRRGRGLGTAMLEHLSAVACAQSRTTLTTEVAAPLDGPASGRGHPAVEFATRRGFTVDISDVVRVLDLPADTGRLEQLAAEAAPYHRDYTLRGFSGPVPEDILGPFGTLIGSLMTEAPAGEVAREAEVLDEARIRADEQLFAASGRTKYTTVALSSDGEPVAYSELVVPRHDPDHVYQWGTLVRRDHRGHRLGTATKVHNVVWLQSELGRPAALVTTNAEVNRHMIAVAVNEAIGFRPVERLVELHRRLRPRRRVDRALTGAGGTRPSPRAARSRGAR